MDISGRIDFQLTTRKIIKSFLEQSPPLKPNSPPHGSESDPCEKFPVSLLLLLLARFIA